MTTKQDSAVYWIERCLLQLQQMNKTVQDINDSLRQRRQELVREAVIAGYYVFHCSYCGRHVAQASDGRPLCTCGDRMIRSDQGDRS